MKLLLLEFDAYYPILYEHKIIVNKNVTYNPLTYSHLKKFALMIDMDRTYLASVENGRRNISLENIYKIANGFHITLEELFKDMK